MLKIKYADTAIANLEKIPPPIAAQILRKIRRLSSGLKGDIKRLNSYDCDYRLRSGDYRILFDLNGHEILIQRIKHRKEAYD